MIQTNLFGASNTATIQSDFLSDLNVAANNNLDMKKVNNQIRSLKSRLKALYKSNHRNIDRLNSLLQESIFLKRQLEIKKINTSIMNEVFILIDKY